jgi:hypothetical protein
MKTEAFSPESSVPFSVFPEIWEKGLYLPWAGSIPLYNTMRSYRVGQANYRLRTDDNQITVSAERLDRI